MVGKLQYEPCCPGCPGWAVFNDNEIQRCDECGRFADDDEAVIHVNELARAEGRRLRCVSWNGGTQCWKTRGHDGPHAFMPKDLADE